MDTPLQYKRPREIEERSFAIIREELGGREFPAQEAPIIYRAIHTSADFDYADSLAFSPGAVEHALAALRQGACIVTDTQMAKSGINRAALQQAGCEVFCFMADEDVAQEASRRGVTRAVASIDKAVRLNRPTLFAIGNAPTALIRLYEHITAGFSPALVIGVPVGFVNVVESKEWILSTQAPYIVARDARAAAILPPLSAMPCCIKLPREPFEERRKIPMEVKLDRWRWTDFPALLKYANDPQIAENLRDIFPYPYTEKNADIFLTNCIRDDGHGKITG